MAKKLEIHHTPKHGSWLNMVESELSVLVRQCLNRRIVNMETLEKEVSIWEYERNHASGLCGLAFLHQKMQELNFQRFTQPIKINEMDH
ncbi:MAG: hypothetical protein F6K22_28970 [Okeania sp. SIO2F4]|uniref:transposase n=1 Tax=Okeania sp. SIO2F4 TaxID=2607790 RepID=UPI0014291B40|nr:hypothetical protein [Okeania sp. SIO2F4]